MNKMKRNYNIDPSDPEYPYLVVDRSSSESALSTDVTSHDGRKLHWIPHEKEGYVSAEVVKENDGDDVTVKTEHGDVRFTLISCQKLYVKSDVMSHAGGQSEAREFGASQSSQVLHVGRYV